MTENEDTPGKDVDWQALDMIPPPDNGDETLEWLCNAQGKQQREIKKIKEAQRGCWAKRLGDAWPIIATVLGGLSGAGVLTLLVLKIAESL